jgi:predicted DNA-binding transcriptional regulator AlpA
MQTTDYDPRARLLTVEEVGERIQLSPATILNRYTNRFPFVRVGRRLMLSEADLLTWIEERRSTK